ncbi:MAG: hypothetical protein KDB44_01435 [Mycobacterium sp.]|nr:hypothetical protein [Mycobacterium sp.]
MHLSNRDGLPRHSEWPLKTNALVEIEGLLDTVEARLDNGRANPGIDDQAPPDRQTPHPFMG